MARRVVGSSSSPSFSSSSSPSSSSARRPPHRQRIVAIAVAPTLALLCVAIFGCKGGARANVAEEQKQMFDEEGIQRGSFLNGQWVSYPQHGAPDRCATSVEEKSALEAIYNKMGGTGWTTKWNLVKCPCLHQWHGVVCDAQGNIVSLDLSQNGLTGTIASEFSGLKWLNSLKLYANALTGCIPAFFGELPNLQTLYLQNNKLVGAVPHSVANLPYLVSVFVDTPLDEDAALCDSK
jgi:hypothetical protein